MSMSKSTLEVEKFLKTLSKEDFEKILKVGCNGEVDASEFHSIPLLHTLIDNHVSLEKTDNKLNPDETKHINNEISLIIMVSLVLNRRFEFLKKKTGFLFKKSIKESLRIIKNDKEEG